MLRFAPSDSLARETIAMTVRIARHALLAWGAFVYASFLSSCAATAPERVQVPTGYPASALLSDPSGTAELVVLNISGWTLSASNVNIMDNGSPIASLPRQSFKKVRIAPGRHEFRFDHSPRGPRVAVLEAQATQTYYLAAGYSPARSMLFPLGGDSLKIQIVTEADARSLMSEMKPL